MGRSFCCLLCNFTGKQQKFFQAYEFDVEFLVFSFIMKIPNFRLRNNKYNLSKSGGN